MKYVWRVEFTGALQRTEIAVIPVDACDAAGVRYEFKKMKSGFVVCFYRSVEKADKSTDKVRISMDKLTPTQVKIVEYLLENKTITNKEVQDLLGVKDLRALKI